MSQGSLGRDEEQGSSPRLISGADDAGGGGGLGGGLGQGRRSPTVPARSPVRHLSTRSPGLEGQLGKCADITKCFLGDTVPGRISSIEHLY